MVVHNSKWDRKAKQKYLKKHNLTADDVARHKDKPDTSIEHGPQAETDASSDHELEVAPELTESTEGEQIEMFHRPYLPDLAPEDLDQTRIIREAGSQAVRPPPPAKKNVHVVSEAEFAKANADVERSRMNHRVRTRLGKKLDALEEPKALEADDDFDEFMRTTASQAPSLPAPSHRPIATQEIDNDKQDFIDSLL